MPRPNTRLRTKPRRWLRALAWGVPALLVLGIVGVFVAKAAIDAYLRSDDFRQFVAGKAGATLRAEAEVASLQFSGTSVYGESFHARGGKDAAFSELHLDGLRAELSLRRFFEKVWQVDSVDVQRVSVRLDGSRADLADAPPFTPKKASGGGGWLPDRVELAQTTVHDANLLWAGGKLSGVGVQITPEAGGWRIAGSGGRIEQAGLPALDVRSARLLYREPSLFVQSAEFHQPGGGIVTAIGEVNFEDRADLTAKLERISLTPFLTDDWRVRLRGNASGEVKVRARLPLRAPPEISGTIALADGELEALPVLDQIAAFTRTQQFRRLKLTRASAEFRHTGPKLAVTNFIAESEGLIRMEGNFTIEGDRIDGTFQVGVTSTSLQWLPGSQARVFTESRAGYLWTPMRMSGPLSKPEEDLTPRLIAAAGDAAIETVKGAVNETIKTGKDAVKSAFDLLLSPSK